MNTYMYLYRPFFLLMIFCGAQVIASPLAVRVDGSSTVFPLNEAVAEDFQIKNPTIRVMVGASGTGGGMKKFIAGEIDIAAASRPISSTENAAAKAKGLEFVELPVAYDGLVVVVHPSNTFVNALTVEELKKIWSPESPAKLWSEVRKGFPAEKISLYGPGSDSGTFDYFTEVINGKAKVVRKDFTASEDDNVLVQGISRDKGALGYFGFSYYLANKSKLKLVPIGPASKPVVPSVSTINSGEYTPLSRPLFVYVSAKSVLRPEVKSFVRYYLEQMPVLTGQVGYVPFESKIYTLIKKRFDDNQWGTSFLGSNSQDSLEKLILSKGK